MNHQQMWQQYSEIAAPEGGYAFWSFGDEPDHLAQLVLSGVKTGTASLLLWYEQEHAALPAVGEYNVILDSRDEAVCVTRTTRVYTLPFCEVSADHAFREGEGDRSLAYWRRVHERYFSEELRKDGLTFDSRMQVVCEEFEKVFP